MKKSEKESRILFSIPEYNEKKNLTFFFLFSIFKAQFIYFSYILKSYFEAYLLSYTNMHKK